MDKLDIRDLIEGLAKGHREQRIIRTLPKDAPPCNIRCKCGHAQRYHKDYLQECDYCNCVSFRQRETRGVHSI